MRTNSMTRFWLAAWAAAVLAIPSVGFAQEDAETTEATEEAADTAAEEAPAEEAPAEDAAETEKVDPSDDTKGKAAFPRIADDEETIYAVQRKAYLVKNKWEISPLFGVAVNDQFVQTFGIGASITYHLAENFGVEVYGQYMLPNESALTDELREVGFVNPDVARLTQMRWTAGAGVQWSPIYGKIHIFDEYLGNFAIYIGAGLGIGQTRVECTNGAALDPNRGFDPPQCETNQDASVVLYEPDVLKPMGSISGGLRFNFSNSLGVKFEVRDYIYAARVYRPPVSGTGTGTFSDSIRNNVFVQFGISWLLGGEDN